MKTATLVSLNALVENQMEYPDGQEKNGPKIARSVFVTDPLSECIVQNTNVLCHSKCLVLNQDTCLFRHRYQKIHAVPGLSATAIRASALRSHTNALRDRK